MNKNFKKGLALMTAVMVGAMGITGCGNSTDASSSNTSSNASSNGGSSSEGAGVYKIGGIGPLTGGAASYGISVKQGAQIAIDEINAAGGVNGYTLELLFEDDECDEEKAISAYNKLMDQDITALMGAVTSGCSIAVSGESIGDGILQITPSGSAQDCTKYDNAFRICFTDPLQGKTMADYIADQGFKSVAVIYDVADEYSKGITEAFVAAAGERGLNIATQESFTSGDVDFKTQLTKIKGTDADCIFLPIYYTEVAYISEQAPTVGVNLPYFGCDGWDGVIAQLEGDTTNIEGAIFLTPFVANSEQANVQSFVAAYKAAFGDASAPDQFAADGYDAIYVIKAAIEACDGDVTNENLIAAMTKVSVDGLTGSMTFTADGEPDKSAMVAVIENGEYVGK